MCGLTNHFHFVRAHFSYTVVWKGSHPMADLDMQWRTWETSVEMALMVMNDMQRLL